MPTESTSDLTRSDKLIDDLETLTQEDGFPYTFAYLILAALWTSKDEMADIDWHTRPNHKELSLLLGLMIKHPLRLTHVPTRQLVDSHIARANRLFKDLQAEHLFFPTSSTNVTPPADTTPLHEKLEAYDNWMTTGRGMVEPIFYGGSGANDFQYLQMADKRYRHDRNWIRTQLGISIAEINSIARALKQLTHRQVNHLPTTAAFRDLLIHCLTALTFAPDDLPNIQKTTMERFLELFAVIPGTDNTAFCSIADYNVIHSKPIVRINSRRYFLPLYDNLAESVYESPYYWMLEDASYSNQALANRGNATEEIAHDLLTPVFGNENVYRGVKVRHGKNELTDIDVLAVSQNKAVIVQAKSKKLTITSRQGDGESLTNDFQRAVQNAYEQGLVARKALLQSIGAITGSTDRPIRLDQPIDEVYLVCLTGDHYPALATQVARYLVKTENDPHPVAMSAFDLEVVAHYLNEAVEFIYYLRQRSTYSSYFRADSEITLLGFHLSNKLFPAEQADGFYVHSDYAQLVDLNFRVAMGHWPSTESAHRLFHQWRNELFDRIVEQVKAGSNACRMDVLFLLFDLAGDAADNITRIVESIQLKTRIDGQSHDASFPISRHSTGITFVSIAPLLTTRERQDSKREFPRLALARKHKGRADEWLALASIAGSEKAFDMLWYSNEPWRPDAELDDLVRSVLKPGTFLRAECRKIGRNESCPCGSGIKFKRCHDRLRYK